MKFKKIYRYCETVPIIFYAKLSFYICDLAVFLSEAEDAFDS